VLSHAGYLQKYKKSKPAATSHEVNRDPVVWFCRDLLPFELVAKDGFKDFCGKNVHDVHLPLPETSAAISLDDVYQIVKSVVEEKLANVKSFCLMFDGWTDMYKARPYLGVRASFLNNWSFTVVALGCHVLSSHTANEMLLLIMFCHRSRAFHWIQRNCTSHTVTMGLLTWS